jgi:hypothetical protein
VRQSPVRSTRPGCASTEQVRTVPHIAGRRRADRRAQAEPNYRPKR